jgi:hypothetical protein
MHNIANCITNLQNFVVNNASDVTFQVSLFAKERMRKIHFTAVLNSTKGRNVDALPPIQNIHIYLYQLLTSLKYTFFILCTF